MSKERVTARLFFAKEYGKALEHKEETGGLLFRTLYNNQVMYEVRYLPPPEPWYVKQQRAISQRHKAMKNWPIWIHIFIALNKYSKPCHSDTP